MRPPVVVVTSPFFDFLFGFFKRGKQICVEALISQSAIEAFDVRVFRGLSWPNKMKLNLVFIGPTVLFFSCEFTAIVHHDYLWKPMERFKAVQCAHHLGSFDAVVDFDSNTLTAKVIDYRQRSNLPAVGQLVVYKIHAPDSIARLRAGQRRPVSGGRLLPSLGSHLEP